MALKNLIDDIIFKELQEGSPEYQTHLQAGHTPGDVIQQLILDLINDSAVRGEVWDTARFTMTADGASIADVHAVLDSLARVLQDEHEPAPAA